jgi:hypothetical protein
VWLREQEEQEEQRVGAGGYGASVSIQDSIIIFFSKIPTYQSMLFITALRDTQQRLARAWFRGFPSRFP